MKLLKQYQRLWNCIFQKNETCVPMGHKLGRNKMKVIHIIAWILLVILKFVVRCIAKILSLVLKLLSILIELSYGIIDFLAYKLAVITFISNVLFIIILVVRKEYTGLKILQLGFVGFMPGVLCILVDKLSLTLSIKLSNLSDWIDYITIFNYAYH